MNFLEELQYRGLVKDVTDLEGFKERLKEPMTVYCGFDPTADSLHIGHLQQLLLLRRYQEQGHTPIAVLGGATGMIGDPRPTTERKLLNLEEIRENGDKIQVQLTKFLKTEGDNAMHLVNNYDWLSKLDLLTFLRDYGKFFSINTMMNKETIASRLDSGISFTEFSYTILQAIDFYHLHKHYGCDAQIGGSDQWGNLVSGTDLIRKLSPESKVYGITSPLITKSDGSKFGKSEGKNIWLDPEKTSAYHFYQYWLNVGDSDVINFIKRLTFIPVEAIEALAESVEKEAHLRKAQQALADELTKLLHGEEGLESAKKISAVFFSNSWDKLSLDELKLALEDAPKLVTSEDCLLIDALVSGKVVSSKREARELIQNGSITVNGVKQTSLETVLTNSQALFKQLYVIRKGKKTYFTVEFEGV